MASRRSVFAGSAAMLLGPSAALATAHPDGEIFALCVEHTELERRKVAAWACYPYPMDFDQEEALDKIYTDSLTNRQGEIIDRLCEIEARTAQGLLAKMAWLVAFDSSMVEPSEADGTVAERMLPGIFRNGLDLRDAGTGSA